jgi:ABC-type antimicrobial peptide transport system permease subunit
MGLPIMFALTRLAAALLFGLTPADPISLVLSVVLIMLVALLAGYLPSRRATRIDPLIALRYE